MANEETLDKLVKAYFELVKDSMGFNAYEGWGGIICIDTYENNGGAQYIKDRFKEILDAETEG